MPERDRERWNARYRASPRAAAAPSSFLESLAPRLPRVGRALDVAGGAGANALWLAARGLDVTLVDIADEALSLASEHAAAASLPIHCQQRDLETEGIPAGPWAVICNMNYLWRPLFSQFCQELEPEGWLVVCHPTRRNLERHDKPSERYLLEDGELALLTRDLTTVLHEEAWQANGRHESRLLARRSSVA